jgi:hypothetical protein
MVVCALERPSGNCSTCQSVPRRISQPRNVPQAVKRPISAQMLLGAVGKCAVLEGALRRLDDQTIVRTRVQFAVTEFASALMAMDWEAPVRDLSPADKS